MKGIGALAVLVIFATLAGLAAGIYYVFTEIGAERIWQVITIAVFASLGIAFLRVYLHGLAKIAEAKRAGLPERHFYHDTKERHTHTIDGRPGAPLQLPGLPSDSNLALFPAAISAAWRLGIEAGQDGEPGEVIDGEKRELEPARRVWQ